MEKKPHFSPWYFVAGLLVLLAVQTLYFPQAAQPLPYSDFKSLLKQGKVRSVTIGADSISGKLKTPQPPPGVAQASDTAGARRPHGSNARKNQFVTARVSDPSLVPEPEARHVQFTGRMQHKWLSTILGWVMPAVMLVALWAVLMRRMGGGGLTGIGKSKGKVYMQKKTSVTFADVAGIDEAKAELMEVVQFLAGPGRYRQLGGKIPKGVLIAGAPGTGKTLLQIPRMAEVESRAGTG